MSNVDIGLIVSFVSIVIAAITAMVAMCTKLKKKVWRISKRWQLEKTLSYDFTGYGRC